MSDFGAFESALGETVLRDLHSGTLLLHLPAQCRHLGNGETGIVSDHDRLGGLEDPLQRRDLLLLFRSVHFSLRLAAETFPAAGFTLPARDRRMRTGGNGSALH